MMIWWIAIGFISRLIIHTPDATPITTLALLAPRFFSLRQSLLMILSILITSDLGLHLLFQYPIFGSWSFFTYSGWALITLLGNFLSRRTGVLQLLFLSATAAMIFWLWTNLGTWCATSLYPHNMPGLITCYYDALPFLSNNVISAMSWSGAIYIFLCYDNIHRHIPMLCNNMIHFLKFIRQTN